MGRGEGEVCWGVGMSKERCVGRGVGKCMG